MSGALFEGFEKFTKNKIPVYDSRGNKIEDYIRISENDDGNYRNDDVVDNGGTRPKQVIRSHTNLESVILDPVLTYL